MAFPPSLSLLELTQGTQFFGFASMRYSNRVLACLTRQFCTLQLATGTCWSRQRTSQLLPLRTLRRQRGARTAAGGTHSSFLRSLMQLEWPNARFTCFRRPQYRRRSRAVLTAVYATSSPAGGCARTRRSTSRDAAKHGWRYARQHRLWRLNQTTTGRPSAAFTPTNPQSLFSSPNRAVMNQHAINLIAIATPPAGPGGERGARPARALVGSRSTAVGHHHQHNGVWGEAPGAFC